jgi:hypothetical protein
MKLFALGADIVTAPRDCHVSQLPETAWVAWPLGVLYGSR